MTQEVLKLALGALEDFVDVIKYDNEQDDIGRRACCDVLSYNPHSESCKAIKSIASLRQAIAELESQEPVATVTSETGADITMSWWHEPALPVGTKLFTHPPQRTWVGLTDEEVVQCQQGNIYHFYRCIEAKLKEKNT